MATIVSIMEIYELKYFLAVAEFENVHKASERLRVSPGSLSKAVRRLEEETSSSLFDRIGRGIKLTEKGRFFKNRAAQIVALSEDLKTEIAGKESAIEVHVSGPEFLMTYFSQTVTSMIQNQYRKARFNFYVEEESEAIQKLRDRSRHMVLTTNAPSEFNSKKIGTTKFQTVMSKNHAKFSRWKNAEVPITEILQTPFTSSSFGLLGKMNKTQSPDGWRDDKFPRDIRFICSSLATLVQIVASGSALAYLPDFIAEDQGFRAINITGCPYSCSQNVYLLTGGQIDQTWLRRIW